MSIKEFFINVGVRLENLVIKFISVKGVGFGIATTLLALGKLDSLMWFFCLILLVSTRLLEKVFVPK